MDIYVLTLSYLQVPGDLNGAKIARYGAVTLADIEALGAIFVEMPASELSIGLQTGVIDGVAVSSAAERDYLLGLWGGRYRRAYWCCGPNKGERYS